MEKSDISTSTDPTGDSTQSTVAARTAMTFADDITWHFLTKYLPKQKSSTILDAGGGDGFWAQKLVEKGYKNIVLTDISQEVLHEAKKRFASLKTSHNVKCVKSDITDMKEFKSNIFDYVFSQYDAVSYCMHPQKAVKELARVANPGAYVIVSLDTKYRRVPELLEAGQIDNAITLLNTNISYDFGHPQYNLTWEELSAYYEKAGLTVVEVVGAPVFMHQIAEAVLENLEQKRTIRKKLLKIELENCTKKSLINFAGHLQMIGKKE
jgi:ubiquinone/menaquinone biosynthesis C-methylase UbiE